MSDYFEATMDTGSQEYQSWLASLTPGDKATVCEVKLGKLHRGRILWYEVTIDRIDGNKIVTIDKNDLTTKPRFIDGLTTNKALKNSVAIFPDGLKRGY